MVDEAIILNLLESFFKDKSEFEKKPVDKEKIKKLIKDIEALNNVDNEDVEYIVKVLRDSLKESLDDATLEDINNILESIHELFGLEAIDEMKRVDEYNNSNNFAKTGKYKNMKRNQKVDHHLSRINHHLEQLKRHNPRLHKQLSSLHHM